MTKIKEILEANIVAYAVSGEAYIAKQSIDTAASAIEKVHDEEMVGFAEWLACNYVPSVKDGVFNFWTNNFTEKHTTAQLLQLYKNRK